MNRYIRLFVNIQILILLKPFRSNMSTFKTLLKLSRKVQFSSYCQDQSRTFYIVKKCQNFSWCLEKSRTFHIVKNSQEYFRIVNKVMNFLFVKKSQELFRRIAKNFCTVNKSKEFVVLSGKVKKSQKHFMLSRKVKHFHTVKKSRLFILPREVHHLYIYSSIVKDKDYSFCQ